MSHVPVAPLKRLRYRDVECCALSFLASTTGASQGQQVSSGALVLAFLVAASPKALRHCLSLCRCGTPSAPFALDFSIQWNAFFFFPSLSQLFLVGLYYHHHPPLFVFVRRTLSSLSIFFWSFLSFVCPYIFHFYSVSISSPIRRSQHSRSHRSNKSTTVP